MLLVLAWQPHFLGKDFLPLNSSLLLSTYIAPPQGEIHIDLQHRSCMTFGIYLVEESELISMRPLCQSHLYTLTGFVQVSSLLRNCLWSPIQVSSPSNHLACFHILTLTSRHPSLQLSQNSHFPCSPLSCVADHLAAQQPKSISLESRDVCLTVWKQFHGSPSPGICSEQVTCPLEFSLASNFLFPFHTPTQLV